MRTPRRSRIPASPWSPPRWRLGSSSASTGRSSCAPWSLGYDVGTRVVLTMGGASVQSEEHRSTHSIMGIFGAAAAAACAASLNPQQMRWVLDYTAQQSSGIAAWQRDTQHIEKGFVFAGMPARSGVTSALLVESGWTGVDDIFSGADNFFLAYAPQAESGGTGRQAWRALRSCGNRHQEMDRGSAHPGAARRAGNSAEAAPILSGRGAAGDRASCHGRRGPS